MKLFYSPIVAAMLLISGAAMAETQTTEQTVAAALKEKMGISALGVSASPIAGLYEVITEQGIIYVTGDGSKFVHGQIFDMNDRMTNLTEQSMAKVRLGMLDEVKDSVIEFKAKDEKHVVYAFTDITCGYCRKLHEEMAEYNDNGITIRYLAFPRGGDKSRGWTDMQNIWCAKDQRQAMTDGKAGKTLDSAQCPLDLRVQKHYDLGNAMGVNGTPSMVLANGTMLPGYLPPKQLLNALERQ